MQSPINANSRVNAGRRVRRRASKTSRAAVRAVALIYDARLPYDVKVMSGVAEYLQRRETPWTVQIEENALHQQRLPDLTAWHGDGILADFDDPHVAAQVTAAGIPAVAFGSGYGWYRPSSGIPYFYADQRAVARLAAEHLLQRGFRHFAYYGYRPGAITGFSAERGAAFEQCVRAAGCRVWTRLGPYGVPRQWTPLQALLRAWLASLPKPLGLLAANDKAARQVLDACRAAGLRVPEEVAVVGVDNDEMLCQLSNPPLSSIEQGARRIGFQAAALLDRMMSGWKPRRLKYVVAPEGMVTRRSSEIIAVEDENVATALTLIRAQAVNGIKVSDVVQAVAISRSQLERSFKAALGSTLHDEIRRVRLDQAKRLLAASALPIKQVALRCGFRTVQHLTATFRQFVGTAPAAYRREHAR